MKRKTATKQMVNDPMEEQQAPPLGCKPAWMVAWSRIGDLAGAIQRQYESAIGNAQLVGEWAKEIQMQCKIIEIAEQSFKARHN